MRSPLLVGSMPCVRSWLSCVSKLNTPGNTGCWLRVCNSLFHSASTNGCEYTGSSRHCLQPVQLLELQVEQQVNSFSLLQPLLETRDLRCTNHSEHSKVRQYPGQIWQILAVVVPLYHTLDCLDSLWWPADLCESVTQIVTPSVVDSVLVPDPRRSQPRFYVAAVAQTVALLAVEGPERTLNG